MPAAAHAMLPLLRGYERLQGSHLIRDFTRGLTSTSVGLIAAATLGIGQATLTTPTAWAVCGLTLVLHQALKWHALLSLVVAGGAGRVLDRWLWVPAGGAPRRSHPLVATTAPTLTHHSADTASRSACAFVSAGHLRTVRRRQDGHPIGNRDHHDPPASCCAPR